jgi:hypothetical protein
MRLVSPIGVSALALLAGLGVAAAQQPRTDGIGQQLPQGVSEQQRQANEALDSKSGQGGKEEPGSHAATTKPMNTPVLVNGALAVEGAPADSQTVPSIYSERNARLDGLPIMAMPLGLSEEDKRRIAESVRADNATQAPTGAQPSQQLPSGIEMHELPKGVADIPAVRDLKYVRLSDRILLVQAPNRIVVGEIAL